MEIPGKGKYSRFEPHPPTTQKKFARKIVGNLKEE